ncbi:MAG: DUF4340 domain-containing protein [Bacteroidia bacterium]|nr:DUF4340 domain-containing protein [Bacteroidia bacterium]
MFKRFSNKQIIAVLGVLSALYLLALAFGGKSERTFKKTLSALDTTLVSEILITPPGGGQVKLSRSAGNWSVQLPGGTQAPVVSGMATRALESIAFLDAKQLVSRSETQWSEYKVDTAGTQVTVFAGKDKVLDLILGRFEYKQTGMMSYVRENGEAETYLVNGFLESSFNRKTDDWRNKTILKGPQSQWTSVAFLYPADSSFQMIKKADNTWVMSDSSALNPTEVNTWLNAAANTNGSTFVDNPPAVATPIFQMMVQATAGPIEVKVYEDANYKFLLSSTQNPGVYFSDTDGAIVKKLFVGKTKFLPKDE